MDIYCLAQKVSDVPEKIHILPIGEWKARKFKITKAHCAEVIRNFEESGIDLVIDYEHQSITTAQNGQPAPAAGWIKQLELKEDGVWGEVEWTEEAKEMLQSKKYKYLSPTILFDSKDPHSGKNIGTTVVSVALTNMPFLRGDLTPIINSVFNNQQKPSEAEAENKEVTMSDAEKIAALEADKAKKEAEILALKQENKELAEKVKKQEEQSAQAAEAKMVDDAIAAKKLLPGQKEAGLIVAKQGKEVFDKFIAGNTIPDLTKKVGVDSTEGGSLKYEDLLKDAKKMEQCKTETPELFAQLRKEYIGG